MKTRQSLFSRINGLLAILLLISVWVPAFGTRQAAVAASANLASGATVAGYSTQSGVNVVANVYDGQPGTYWQSTAIDRSQNPWFALNLGSAQAFNKVELDFILNNSLSSYKIQYSLDGTSWNDAYSGQVRNKDNNKDNPKKDAVTFPAVTGQYVKVIFQFSQLVESQGPVWTANGSTKIYNDPTCGGASPCYIYTNNFQLAEIGLYQEGSTSPSNPEPDANLALGAAVSSYSTQGASNTAANMVDGRSETFWQPLSGDRAVSGNGAWVVLDLGSAKSFNKAVIQMPLSNGVDKARLEYSSNGADWTKIYESAIQNKGTSAKTETLSFDAVSGRYVKLTITFANATPNFQLSEFQLYHDIPQVPELTEPAPVTSAFTISADGQASVYWTDPVTSAVYLPFDHVQISDGNRVQTVAKGQQSVTFTSLTNGRPYPFAIQTVTADGKKSARTFISAVPTAGPGTLLYDPNQLLNVKSKLKTGEAAWYAEALQTLQADAELAMSNGPYAVTFKTGIAPSGNKHDYWSSAPYWWPDPTSPSGLPYINRDGVTNPEGMTEKYDKMSFTLLRTTVSTLALAYYYTEDEKYAARAAYLLRTWFLDEATRMNPNMNYAQGIPGAEDGRKEGVLETDKLFEIIDSIQLISRSGSWTTEDTRGFKSWLSAYTDWLQTNKLALAEKATLNNHGTWYDAQLVTYRLYLGHRDEVKAYLQETSAPRIVSQILPDGTMPEELRRTRPFHYFLYNLIPFSMLSIIGDHVDLDMWQAGGGGIRHAYQFITPYIVDFSQWPYDELKDEDERAFSRYLREAAVRFGEDSLWSAADMMLADQLHTHRASLIAPNLNKAAPRKEIVDFQFQGLYTPVRGKIQDSLIELNVPRDTDVTGLIATFKTTGSSVTVNGVPQISGVTPIDFTNTVTYSVMSPEGTVRAYTVKVRVLPERLPVTVFETAFTEYRNNPKVEEGLAQSSSNNLYDIITPIPEDPNQMESGQWYKGFLDQGVLKAPAHVFVKDGNSAHTRSMPAALRLLKDAADGSAVTLRTSTKDFKNLSVSFAARTQNTQMPYTVYGEWSVDGGASWQVAHVLKRDSANTSFTETYGNNRISFAISDPRANDREAFLFRLRLDASSAGYVNMDDFRITGEPLYDLTARELVSFQFQGIQPPVDGVRNGTDLVFTLPAGTDVSDLVASFQTTGTRVKVGAVQQVSCVTANDFASPVVYRVEAADGSWRNYTVKVQLASKPGTENPDNGGGSSSDGDSGTNGGSGSGPANGTGNPSDTGREAVVTAVIEKESSGDVVLASIEDSAMTRAFSAAAVRTDGTRSVAVKIPEVQGARTITVRIPYDFISSTRSTDRTTLVTQLGSLTIPSNMLQLAKGDTAPVIQLSLGIVDPAAIPATAAASLGDRPVYTFKVIVNGKETAWEHAGAPVTISLPYKPTAEELRDSEHLVVGYIADHGEVTPVSNSRYNAATGTMTFTTHHFSQYAIQFVRKTFEDLEDYGWAAKQIGVLASKGIIQGTSDTAFQPGVTITRADFLMLLIRTLGLNGQAEEVFDDVLPSDYYYEATAVAKKLGITDGVGDNKFHPSAPITRQEMMALTARAMQITGKINLDGSSRDLAPFQDADRVAPYAADSIATMIKQGLIEGTAERLHPEANATRAETAVLMYRIYNK
ncbi:alginate lyase family protein [Paenibacillus filicis]|uniref:Alginate lyase family protein n=1 Tax=Paenibacillus filicis TaxID=669464 RepID=A0ABU9DQK5_9BACL